MIAEKKLPAKLSQRQVIGILFRDRAARAYTFSALGALAMIFVVMYLNGSDIGGVLVVLLGSAALVLRWTAMPPFLLLVIAYFHACPFGIPDFGSENPYQVRETYFQVADMVLVMAILVYLRAQYRLFGFVHQIMPFENVFRRKGDVPTRRPSSHIRPDEIAWLVGITGGIVLLGQGAWWLVNALEFAPMENFPLRWSDPKSLRVFRRDLPPGEFRAGQHRFFVILGAMFFGTLLLRLVFSYWQLRMMSAAEGAMVMTDTSWAESHRERVRVEQWRIWGRTRAAEAAKQAEQERKQAARKAEQQREKQAAKERERERKANRAQRD